MDLDVDYPDQPSETMDWQLPGQAAITHSEWADTFTKAAGSIQPDVWLQGRLYKAESISSALTRWAEDGTMRPACAAGHIGYALVDVLNDIDRADTALSHGHVDYVTDMYRQLDAVGNPFPLTAGLVSLNDRTILAESGDEEPAVESRIHRLQAMLLRLADAARRAADEGLPIDCYESVRRGV